MAASRASRSDMTTTSPRPPNVPHFDGAGRRIDIKQNREWLLVDESGRPDPGLAVARRVPGKGAIQPIARGNDIVSVRGAEPNFCQGLFRLGGPRDGEVHSAPNRCRM